MSYMYNDISDLVGKKVKRIFMNDQFLKFETDQGNFSYTVSGDCCSHSYFHDFLGVKKLLEGGKVTKVEEIDLVDETKLSAEEKAYVNDGELKIYGFRIIFDDEKWGELSAVFSFRNSSNGYYGGSLDKCLAAPEDSLPDVKPEIFDDVIEAVSSDIPHKNALS